MYGWERHGKMPDCLPVEFAAYPKSDVLIDPYSCGYLNANVIIDCFPLHSQPLWQHFSTVGHFFPPISIGWSMACLLIIEKLQLVKKILSPVKWNYRIEKATGDGVRLNFWSWETNIFLWRRSSKTKQLSRGEGISSQNAKAYFTPLSRDTTLTPSS